MTAARARLPDRGKTLGVHSRAAHNFADRCASSGWPRARSGCTFGLRESESTAGFRLSSRASASSGGPKRLLFLKIQAPGLIEALDVAVVGNAIFLELRRDGRRWAPARVSNLRAPFVSG
jgi:hypothetical protein